MNILYGVPGEGLGHATRSKVVIGHLLAQGHQVCVVSSSRAYQMLAAAFPGRVHEIRGFHLAYKGLAVSKARTAVLTLRTAPDDLRVNFAKYRDLLCDFKPELIISDFESFSYLFAKMHRLPIISIDNMQIISRAKLNVTVPKSERGNFQLAQNIVRAKLPRSRHYFVTTFFNLPLSKPDTTLVPPIIRPEILAAKPTKGQHVLVYQSATNQQNLVPLLQQLPDQEFRVYGFNKEEDHGNVQLRAFSEAGFIADLASSRAVVTNGGFSLISEAVFLQKPICAIPIPAQFEQWLNAAEVEQMGYGRHFETITADNLRAFLYGLAGFETALAGYQQQDNEELFARLDAELALLSGNASPTPRSTKAKGSVLPSFPMPH
ncbi:glycosyltransferase family protein [Hymenobacter sp. BT770]|uniref:MJ1255/VC2487 family glycosyltransferase n=1 Tax=Hymenobacter sp. BT770 TaxID=2886942 RepID=UPI001D107B68|nr:MJ1255/VC2487 family glycosyltransferase [Hymenobacter sp. BT770]MCC3153835.1 UDP-glucuronosyltransferase [Hymenobacter sp. BT770]MDO3415979.1 glycosyltransferase family protein [Hymenobacter sp. BT770]